MSKAKRCAKMKSAERLRDAENWLRKSCRPSDLIGAFCKRYRVARSTAIYELNYLGYGEDVAIQQYEAEGIPWEFVVEPRSGEMYVMPEGSTEYDLHAHHGIL